MSENDSLEYDSELAKQIKLHYDTLQSSDSS